MFFNKWNVRPFALHLNCVHSAANDLHESQTRSHVSYFPRVLGNEEYGSALVMSSFKFFSLLCTTWNDPSGKISWSVALVLRICSCFLIMPSTLGWWGLNFVKNRCLFCGWTSSVCFFLASMRGILNTASNVSTRSFGLCPHDARYALYSFDLSRNSSSEEQILLSLSATPCWTARLVFWGDRRHCLGTNAHQLACYKLKYSIFDFPNVSTSPWILITYLRIQP